MPKMRVQIGIRFEDGSLWATVDEFPGVFATGDDLDELRESLEEGISLMLAGPEESPPSITLAPLNPEPAKASVELVYA